MMDGNKNKLFMPDFEFHRFAIPLPLLLSVSDFLLATLYAGFSCCFL